MGPTNENWARGHAACAAGEPLYLGLDGWSKEYSDYADGWLECLRETAEAMAKREMH